MGNAINGALQGTARNPEAGGKIMTTMIIGSGSHRIPLYYALFICSLCVFKIRTLGHVQRHLKKLWRVRVEILPDGRSARPAPFLEKKSLGLAYECLQG